MRLYKDKSQTFVKRLPQTNNAAKGIVNYDEDNLYPQRVDSIIRRSPIALACIETTADFYNGDGFEFNGNQVFNNDNIDVDNQLFQISLDFAEYTGFAFHINTDIFGNIVSFQPVEFDKLRFSIPDKHGRHKQIVYCDDWASNMWQKKAIKFPMWEFNKQKAQEIIFAHGGIDDFPGFILYWTPKKDLYPYARLDSALDSVQTSGEIQVFELANTQNGWLSATLLKHPGQFKDDDEKAEFIRNVSSIKGAGNANSIVLLEVPDGQLITDLIEQFPANNNDKLFELTNKNVTNRIVQKSRIPPILLGVFPEGGGFFNAQQLQDAYAYANIITQTPRSIIASVFNDIGNSMVNPLIFGNIIEQKFNGTVTNQPA